MQIKAGCAMIQNDLNLERNNMSGKLILIKSNQVF